MPLITLPHGTIPGLEGGPKRWLRWKRAWLRHQTNPSYELQTLGSKAARASLTPKQTNTEVLPSVTRKRLGKISRKTPRLHILDILYSQLFKRAAASDVGRLCQFQNVSLNKCGNCSLKKLSYVFYVLLYSQLFKRAAAYDVGRLCQFQSVSLNRCVYSSLKTTLYGIFVGGLRRPHSHI